MSCMSNGKEYSEGALICQNGRELRCTGNGWQETGYSCGSETSIHPIRTFQSEIFIQHVHEVAPRTIITGAERFRPCGTLGTGSYVEGFRNHSPNTAYLILEQKSLFTTEAYWSYQDVAGNSSVEWGCTAADIGEGEPGISAGPIWEFRQMVTYNKSERWPLPIGANYAAANARSVLLFQQAAAGTIHLLNRSLFKGVEFKYRSSTSHMDTACPLPTGAAFMFPPNTVMGTIDIYWANYML